MQPGRCGHRPLRRRYVSPMKRAAARVAPTKRGKAFGKTGRRGCRPPTTFCWKRCVGADASVRPPDLYRISCDVSLRSQCARWSRNPYSFCRAGCPHPAVPVLRHISCNVSLRGRIAPVGSELSAAGGRGSKVSEWPRSKFPASPVRQRGNFGHRNRDIRNPHPHRPPLPKIF